MTAITDLPLTDRCIACALERLAMEAQRDADNQAIIDDKERTFFKRWASAYRKALYHFLTGTRPVQTPSGGWLIPSATRGGLIHEVTTHGQCSCEAGEKHAGCWHLAMATGVEVGEKAAATPTSDRALIYAEIAELF